jgi:hypothetical protein
MKLILPATFLAAMASLSSVARADTLTVDVEVGDDTSFTLSVAQEGECASAESGGAAVDYDVEVCREHGDALRFDVKRFEHGKKGSYVQHVKVSSKLASGTRTVVGTIAQGKETTEIAATVR